MPSTGGAVLVSGDSPDCAHPTLFEEKFFALCLFLQEYVRSILDDRVQLPGLTPRITPSSLLRNITSGAVGSAAWSSDLLESLLATILRAERAIPDQAQLFMGTTCSCVVFVT